jgi:hypothetical protein
MASWIGIDMTTDGCFTGSLAQEPKTPQTARTEFLELSNKNHI